MRRLFLIAGMMAAFGLAVLAASVAPPSFAGNWSLDKAKSQGLDQRTQGADSVVWAITQDDKQISIDSKVTAPAGAPAGGPGGGGGRGGPAGPRTFTLDGKEVSTPGAGQAGGTNVTKATWSADGKTLELSSVRTGSFNGTDFKATTNEKLQLNGDGKVLTVARHSEGGRGTTDSTMVFNKQ